MFQFFLLECSEKEKAHLTDFVLTGHPNAHRNISTHFTGEEL